MKNYGVYDSIFGEFIESFSTFADAENYVKNRMEEGAKDFKIVRFLNSSNEYETLKSF